MSKMSDAAKSAFPSTESWFKTTLYNLNYCVKFVSDSVNDNVSVKKLNVRQIEIFYIILHLLSLHYNQYTKLISPIVFSPLKF